MVRPRSATEFVRVGLKQAMTCGVPDVTPEQMLIIPPARDGRRWRFSEADKRHIVEEAVQPGTSLSEAAGRYGISVCEGGGHQKLIQCRILDVRNLFHT